MLTFTARLTCAALLALSAGVVQAQTVNERQDPQVQSSDKPASEVTEPSVPETQDPSEQSAESLSEKASRGGLTDDIDAFFDQIDEDGKSGKLDTSCSNMNEDMS